MRKVLRHAPVVGLLVAVMVGAPASAEDAPNAVPAGPPPTGLVSLTSQPTGADADWADIEGASSYRVQVAAKADMKGATEEAAPSSSLSMRGLASATTYYARVVGMDAAGKQIGNWSTVVPFTTAPAPEAPGKDALSVASYNIRCANCYSGFNGERPWAKRRGAVVKQIVSRKPDVIGIQEASQAALKGTKVSQFEDLQKRLNKAGVRYKVTNANRVNCVNPISGRKCVKKYQGASQGTRIFYNSDTVDLVAQGTKALPSCRGCNTRFVAWAILKQKATGDKFFVADTQTQWMAKYATLRQRELRSLMHEVARRNPDHLPVFVVGDFNSTRYQSPTNAPYDEVISRGLVDPLGHTAKSPFVSTKGTAETRIRANYNSHNNFLRAVAKFADWQNGSNLDYIFTSPMRVLSWETVLDLDGNDRIVGTIPSDHNMIMLKAVLP